MRPASALFLLIAAYLALGVFYASKTPYRQAGVLRHQGGALVPDIGAPDERQHANYVAHLLEGRGFPVLEPGSPDLGETYQSHQPPLYYVLAAGWAKVTGARPEESSGSRIRYLNLLLGIGTLWGIFSLGRWGTRNEWLSVAAVAFAALIPMFIALHAAISNDPLLILLCTWFATLCARGVRDGWDTRTAVSCGVIGGLALLTKTTALALAPTAVFALLASVKWGEAKPKPVAWIAVLLLPLIVAGPWMARNQKLYGDPFAIKAFNAAFVGSPRPQDVVIPSRVNTDPIYNAAAERAYAALPGGSPRELIDHIYKDVGMTGGAKAEYWTDWVGWWTARSFVGVFGYMDVFLFEGMPEPQADALYRFVIVLLMVPLVGLAFAFRNGSWDAERAVHLTNLVLTLVVLALFVRFNLQYFQGQARYLYPAIGPLCLGLALGTSQLMRRRKELAWVVVAIGLGLVQIAAVSAVSSGFVSRVR